MDVAVPRADQLPLRRDSRAVGLTLAAVAAVALTATAAVLGATAGADEAAAAATLRGAMVAAPLAAGLYAWRMAPFRRFARLLVAVGLVAFGTTLAESSDSVLYSVGRAMGWGLEVLLVVLLLAFPRGRLETGADRRLARAMAAVAAVCYLPTLLLSDTFQVPSPYTSCRSDCPANAFAVADVPAAGALLAVGSLLVFLVMLGVLVALQGRLTTSGPLGRQVLLPVLLIGMARTALVGCAIVGRELDQNGPLIRESGASLIAALTPLIAIAFLAGLIRGRLFSERALRRLAAGVTAVPAPPALQRAFAEALDDPTVEIAFPYDPARDEWVDGRGRRVATPGTRPDRCVHLVHDRDGAAIAALVCEATLVDRPELLEAAAGLAGVALANLRLEAQMEAAARQLRESRARIAATADRERRRIERDLHDGAQQRLVALRIELGLVEDLVRDDPERGALRIHELEEAVDDTLEDLRSLAHGVCPPLLADRGLAEALHAAAARSPVPVTFAPDGVGRYAPELESAVYFVVLEALQNVAKHADGAGRVIVRLRDDGAQLRFSVRDDGPGADPDAFEHGAGVTNMRDRMAAAGGTLTVASRRGIGTEIRGRVAAR
jgi:signal transduction histidine kinase